jgi:hypothetical protein
MDRFDLHIVNPARDPVADAQLPFDQVLLSKRGRVPLDLALADAKDVFKVVRASGANAYLVPVKYRVPAISLHEARLVALQRHSEMQRAGRRLAELDDGYDGLLWWQFCADDKEALEKDLTPGRILISVDKLDGRIASREQVDEWVRLSAQ